MAQEIYFPSDYEEGSTQDPRERTLLGTIKKYFGSWLGPRQKSPAMVFVTEEKVRGQPPGVRLPWFLPFDEYDTGSAETSVMRQMYRRWLSFAPVKAAVLNKIFGVAALKLQIHPADKHNRYDAENADLARWNLVRRFRGGMTGLTWQVFSHAMADGYSVNEKIWQPQERGKYAGSVALTNLKAKDVGFDLVPKTDQFNNVTSYLGLRYNGDKEFHPADFVHYAHLPMYERPTGVSDLRACYEHMWLYDTAWKLRRIQLTTKSFPILVGLYNKEAQQPGLNAALRKAKALSFLTAPKDCMVQALEIAGQSTDLFRNTIQDICEQIVMAVNGAFLTQMAAGENVRRGDPSKHQSVTDLFKWFLSECICGYVLNDEESGLIKEIVDMNHIASEYPYASLDAVSWEEMKQLADIVDKAREWGLPVSEEWAYEKFAIEAPHDDVEGGDELGGGLGGPPQLGPDGQPLPQDPNAPPGPGVTGVTPEQNGGGTGGSPIDAEPHKAFSDKGGWEPAVRMGHRGGLKGGPARARALPPERRKEIAREGGLARQKGSRAVGVKKHDEAGAAVSPQLSVLTPQKEEHAEKGDDAVDEKLWEECQKVAGNVTSPEPRDLGEIGEVTVSLIDGDQALLNWSMDFHSANNWLESPDLCEKNQVVLDNRERPDQHPFNLYHEMHETRLMAKGMKYDQAHEHANAAEKKLRQRFLPHEKFAEDASGDKGGQFAPKGGTPEHERLKTLHGHFKGKAEEARQSGDHEKAQEHEGHATELERQMGKKGPPAPAGAPRTHESGTPPRKRASKTPEAAPEAPQAAPHVPPPEAVAHLGLRKHSESGENFRPALTEEDLKNHPEWAEYL